MKNSAVFTCMLLQNKVTFIIWRNNFDNFHFFSGTFLKRIETFAIGKKYDIFEDQINIPRIRSVQLAESEKTALIYAQAVYCAGSLLNGK